MRGEPEKWMNSVKDSRGKQQAITQKELININVNLKIN